MCVNYGGRAEIADSVRQIARQVAAGKIKPDKIDERTIARYLDEPDMPDVDLFVRSSGEQRTSNFLLWQSAYAEMVFLDTLFPDFDRRHLWEAVEIYARRDRRFGGALDTPGGVVTDGGIPDMLERRPHGAGALPRRRPWTTTARSRSRTAACSARCRACELDEGLRRPQPDLRGGMGPAGRVGRPDARRAGRRRGPVRHAAGDPRRAAAGTSRCATRSRPAGSTRRPWARC